MENLFKLFAPVSDIKQEYPNITLINKEISFNFISIANDSFTFKRMKWSIFPGTRDGCKIQ